MSVSALDTGRGGHRRRHGGGADQRPHGADQHPRDGAEGGRVWTSETNCPSWPQPTATSLLDWRARDQADRAPPSRRLRPSPPIARWRGGGAGALPAITANNFSATVGTSQMARDSYHWRSGCTRPLAAPSRATTATPAAGRSPLRRRALPRRSCGARANAAAADDAEVQAGAGTGYLSAWSRQAAGTYRTYQDTSDLGSVSRTSAALAAARLQHPPHRLATRTAAPLRPAGALA